MRANFRYVYLSVADHISRAVVEVIHYVLEVIFHVYVSAWSILVVRVYGAQVSADWAVDVGVFSVFTSEYHVYNVSA